MLLEVRQRPLVLLERLAAGNNDNDSDKDSNRNSNSSNSNTSNNSSNSNNSNRLAFLVRTLARPVRELSISGIHWLSETDRGWKRERGIVKSQSGTDDKRCLKADNIITDPRVTNLPSVK